MKPGFSRRTHKLSEEDGCATVRVLQADLAAGGRRTSRGAHVHLSKQKTPCHFIKNMEAREMFTLINRVENEACFHRRHSLPVKPAARSMASQALRSDGLPKSGGNASSAFMVLAMSFVAAGRYYCADFIYARCKYCTEFVHAAYALLNGLHYKGAHMLHYGIGAFT